MKKTIQFLSIAGFALITPLATSLSANAQTRYQAISPAVIQQSTYQLGSQGVGTVSYTPDPNHPCFYSGCPEIVVPPRIDPQCLVDGCGGPDPDINRAVLNENRVINQAQFHNIENVRRFR